MKKFSEYGNTAYNKFGTCSSTPHLRLLRWQSAML